MLKNIKPAAVTPAKEERATRRKGPRARKNAKAAVLLPRDQLRTVKERRKSLSRLPSLGKIQPAGAPAVLTEAAAAPLESPVRQIAADRGLPASERYEIDSLSALVRDPYCLFAFWEISSGTVDRLNRARGEDVARHRWVLRVTPLPEGTPQDFDAVLGVGNCHLSVSANTRFALSLGFLDAHGRYVLVVQGNEVRTPPAAVAAVVDERWPIHRGDLERLLAAGASAMFKAPEESGAAPHALTMFSSFLAQMGQLRAAQRAENS